MAESLEMGPTGPYPRHPQERDATYPNGELVVPIPDVDHVNTTGSDSTHQQRQPSPLPRAPLPARPLTRWDVASLIINKMVGTGIFTAPPTVLLMARSPGLAFALWILGFLYTIIRFVSTHIDGEPIPRD